MSTAVSLEPKSMEPEPPSRPGSKRRRRSSGSSSEKGPLPGESFDRVIETTLIGLLTFMPLAFGATDAWSELIVVCGTVFLAAAACLKLIFVRQAKLVWSWMYVPVALFLGLVALQLVPLPAAWVKTLSPETFAMKTRLLETVPNAAAVLSKMTLSFYPFETAHTLRLLLCAATVFVVAVNTLRRVSQVKGVLLGIAGVAAVVSAIGLMQFATGSAKIYWLFPIEHKNAATFANHSHLGQFLNLSIGAGIAVLLLQFNEIRQDPRLTPSALFTRLDRPDVLIAWGMIGVLCLSSLMLFLSLTRGGMIGWGVAGLIAGIIVLRQNESKGWLKVMIPPVIITVGALALLGFDKVWDRINTVTELDDDARQLDWARWQMSSDIMHQVLPKFPAFGIGMGAHETFYSSVRTVPHWAIAGHADNDYAEIVEEVGGVGAGLAVIFFGGVAFCIIRNLRKDSPETRLITAGLTFSIVAILIQSSTDFGQRLPANFTITAIFAAVLLVLPRLRRSQSEESSAARVWGRRLGGTVALAAVIAAGGWAIFGATRSTMAESSWRQALAIDIQLRNANWAGTNEQYKAILSATVAAAKADPLNIRHQYWLSVYRWQAMTRLRDPQSGDLIVTPAVKSVAAHVIDDLHAIRPLCPTFNSPSSTAGQIGYYVLKRPDAEADIRLGHALAPFDIASYFAVAQLDARQGMTDPKKLDTAKAELADVVHIQPKYFPAAVALAIDELNNPDLAIAAAGQSPRRMLQVFNLLVAKNDPKADVAKALTITGYEKICENADAPVNAVDILGSLYLIDHRWNDAVTCYRRALNLDYRADRCVKLASALERAGQWQQAAVEAKRTLRMNPDSRDARDILARVNQRIPDQQ